MAKDVVEKFDEMLELLKSLGVMGGGQADNIAIQRWIGNIAIDIATLNLVVQGMISVAADGKGDVAFKLTQKGLEHGEEIAMQKIGADILGRMLGEKNGGV